MAEEKESHLKLPMLVVEPDNEFPSWSSKARAVFEDLELWDYVCGTEKMPVVPAKVEPSEKTITDKDGKQVTVKEEGNVEEHEEKSKALIEWRKKDKKAKRMISLAVPASQYQFVDGPITSASAWYNLSQAFMPANEDRADELKREIFLNECPLDADVTNWADDQYRSYVKLTKISLTAMSEKEFCSTMIRMLPPTIFWAERMGNLREKAERHREKFKRNPSALTMINWIKEYDHMWRKVKKAEHKMEQQQSAAAVYATQAPQLKRYRSESNANAQFHLQPPPKRARDTPKNPNAQCTNPHCTKKVGHTIEMCIAHGGGSCGKYPRWWKGPWNIHLHPNQRSLDTNVPPINHQFYPIWLETNSHRATSAPAPAANITLSERISDTRADYAGELNYDLSAACLELEYGMVYHEGLPTGTVGNAEVTPVHCHSSALNPEVAVSQDCIYDSAANRHVFNTRASFSEYEEIEPVKVKGFGRELTSCAVGIGTVVVEGWANGIGKKRIQFVIRNVLHIPTARFNLVSQSQLDKAGVSAEVGNGKVTLHKKGEILIHGHLAENGMYRLNMTPTTQKTPLDNQFALALETMIKTVDYPRMEDFITAF